MFVWGCPMYGRCTRNMRRVSRGGRGSPVRVMNRAVLLRVSGTVPLGRV